MAGWSFRFLYSQVASRSKQLTASVKSHFKCHQNCYSVEKKTKKKAWCLFIHRPSKTSWIVFRSYQPSNNKCHILTENGKDIFSEPRGISRSINWSIHLSCADWITSTTIDGLPWNSVHTFIVPRGRSRLTLANPLTLPLASTCVVLSEMCQQVLEDRHEIRYKHPCLLQGVSQ